MSSWKYFKDNKYYILIVTLLVSLVYGPLLFSTGYYTDLEYVINVKGSMYNWSLLDRFNLIWLKYLTGLKWFNPYYEAILFVVALFITVWLGAYLFTKLCNQIKSIAAFLGITLFLIFPTFTEQFYFQFQCFEMMVAILLLIISALFIHSSIINKKPLHTVFAIILSSLSFGIYQSMLNMIITIYLGMFLLMLFDIDNKTIGRGAITCTIHFISSAIIYKILCLIFCKGGGYFNDKIMWKQYPVSICYHFVKHYIRTVLLGEKYVYTFAFLISILLALACLILLFVNEKAKALFKCIGVIGLIISPFILSIIQGYDSEARTQLALPLATAFLWLFSFATISNLIKKKANLVSLALCIPAIIMIVLNVIPCERLIYSRTILKQADRAYIHRISQDLSSFNCSIDGSNPLPVIIIGTLPTASNESCFVYNEENPLYILTSVFSLDADVEPKYFFSTNRILGAMNVNGYKYLMPNESTFMEEANYLSDNMPSFPTNGYIQETDNYILVKLNK